MTAKGYAMVVFTGKAGLVMVTSQTLPRQVYAVDLERGTCDCPAGRMTHRGCKHVRAASDYYQRIAALEGLKSATLPSYGRE